MVRCGATTYDQSPRAGEWEGFVFHGCTPPLNVSDFRLKGEEFEQHRRWLEEVFPSAQILGKHLIPIPKVPLHDPDNTLHWISRRFERFPIPTNPLRPRALLAFTDNSVRLMIVYRYFRGHS